MRVLVTAGPTRERIDAVRFITNASSGRMGCAVAAAAVAAGYQVTLLLGPCPASPPGGCRVARFVSVADLKARLEDHLPGCDALVMAAAVGDFTVAAPIAGKIKRSAGPVTIRLEPTEDLLAALAARKRPGQVVVAFAVEEGSPEAVEAAARAKMAGKGADLIVANTSAALGAEETQACVLSPAGTVLPWASRSKELLAGEILAILAREQAR